MVRILKKSINYSFIFGCVESSLVHMVFSSCGELGLGSSCSVLASHRGGFS